MSRVGNAVMRVPEGVAVSMDGQVFQARGKLGTLNFEVPIFLSVKNEEGLISIAPLENTKRSRMMWGTTQRALSNIIKGVHEGFSINMEITGTGYRAAVQGKMLVLQLGFSHEIRFEIPEDITIKAEKPTSLQISGANKQKVGQLAAEIRSYRAPEPYKGKGIAREGEKILRKEGKKK